MSTTSVSKPPVAAATPPDVIQDWELVSHADEAPAAALVAPPVASLPPPALPPVKKLDILEVAQATRQDAATFLVHQVFFRILEGIRNQAANLFLLAAVGSILFGIGFVVAGIYYWSGKYLLYYAISMVSALAFVGIAQLFKGLKSLPPVSGAPAAPGLREGAYGAGAGFSHEASSSGFWPGFSFSLPPPVEPYVEGQPIGFPNYNSKTCFVNTAFQMLMNAPSFLKDAVVEGVEERKAQFDAVDRLIAWGLGRPGAQALSDRDIVHLISLLSGEGIREVDWYANVIGNRAARDNTGPALKALDKQVQRFKEARLQGQPIPQLSEAEMDEIRPAFSAKAEECNEELAQPFLKFDEWVVEEKPQPSPAEQARILDYLASHRAFCQKAISKVKERATPVAKSDQQKEYQPPKKFVEFYKQLKDKINGPEAPSPDPNILFGFFSLLRFIRMREKEAGQVKMLNLFLEAVSVYETTKAHSSNLNLYDLRLIMGDFQGQQDGAELFRKFLDFIDKRKHPNLYVTKTTRRVLKEIDTSQLSPGKKRLLELTIEKKTKVVEKTPSAVSDLPAGGVLNKPECTHPMLTLIVPQISPKEVGPALDGKALIQQVFDGYRSEEENDEAIFRDSNGQLKGYVFDTDQIEFDRKPLPYLFVHLNRSGTECKSVEEDLKFEDKVITGNDGKPFKISKKVFQSSYKKNRPVQMPEFLERDGQHYELISVIRHKGSLREGHYIEYSKKDGVWWLLDDESAIQLRLADEVHQNYKNHRKLFEEALFQSDEYLYRPCEASAVTTPLFSVAPPPEKALLSGPAAAAATPKSEAPTSTQASTDASAAADAQVNAGEQPPKTSGKEGPAAASSTDAAQVGKDVPPTAASSESSKSEEKPGDPVQSGKPSADNSCAVT